MSARHLILPILFVLMIAAPAMTRMAGLGSEPAGLDNRNLAEHPEFAWKQAGQASSPVSVLNAAKNDVLNYKDAWDEYYRDNFALKNDMIRLYRSLKWRIFSVSPVPHKVVSGNDGWFFLGESWSEVITESIGAEVFEKSELETISARLRELDGWATANGVDFYLAIAPNKHSVRGEYLPLRRNAVDSKTQQLLAALSSTSVNPVFLLDKRMSDEAASFYKTDTHWKDLGAYFGYMVLCERINAELGMDMGRPLSDFNMENTIMENGDLVRMIGNGETEADVLFSVSGSSAEAVDVEIDIPELFRNRPGNYANRFRNNRKSGKIVLYHDSFGRKLINFLREDFEESLFIHNYKIDPDLVLAEAPDILILEIVERNLDELLEFEVMADLP